MPPESCRKELLIEIPLEAVQKEWESVTDQLARSARVPGFRPGRVPRDVVRRRYQQEIQGEVAQNLLPRYVRRTVEEQKLEVVGKPQFEDLKLQENQPITFKVILDVLPAVELKEYKGLEVTQEEPQVTPEDVDSTLNDLRSSAAVYEPVTDRAAAEGDYVSVSYQGWDTALPKSKPREVKNAMVHLGGSGTVQGFNEHLAGARAGDVRDFQVTYKADFPQKWAAGKTIRYRVEVLSIKTKVLPALDDELAKTISEFGTLEELKDQLRKRLQEQKQREAGAQARAGLVDQLVAMHDFPIPEVLLEERMDRKVQNAVRQLISQGIDPTGMGIDWRQMREGMREQAVRDVKAAFILEKIAAAEKLEVTEEELDQLIREMAQSEHEAPASLKTRLTRDGGLDNLRVSRRNQKALDFVYQNAHIQHPKQSTSMGAESGA